MKYNFIWDAIEAGEVKIDYISTDLIVTNLLTKPLPPLIFARHVRTMALCRL